jgi:hypothetical protein
LNKLREVKTFVKQPGHADSYLDSGLTVNFIRGHNPDFVVFDDSGTEIERIRLNDFTTSQIHDLVRSKGFVQSVHADTDISEELSQSKDSDEAKQSAFAAAAAAAVDKAAAERATKDSEL